MEKFEKFSPCYSTFQRLSTSSYFIIYRITLLFLYALVRFNLRQIQFTHSSDRSRVRKHETQSYRESCVFHFGHFELFIYIYRLKGWYMSADRPRKKYQFTVTTKSVFNLTTSVLYWSRSRNRYILYKFVLIFGALYTKGLISDLP